MKEPYIASWPRFQTCDTSLSHCKATSCRKSCCKLKHVRKVESGMQCVRGIRVVFRPLTNELIEMMWPEDGPVTCQVVEVVHDDGKKQVQNLNRRQCAALTT